MVNNINKLSEFIAKIKHKNHSEEYRKLFIKYYYVGLIFQCRDAFKDYVTKNKYKIIKYDGEFGPELKYVIPFAYWHYQNGTLEKTLSSLYTSELYYFSKNHEEVFKNRKWRPYRYGIPNSEDHNIMYNYRQWSPVPYKDVYKNDMIRFDKPILIIANKYNEEWGEPPINYLDVNLLRWIFDNFTDKYQIIYNRPEGSIITGDNSMILDYTDYEMIKNEYKNVICMEELYRELMSDKINNYNHFQLLLYANSDYFISVHGGSSVLASYFGGINIIYSIRGFEHYFNEFENFYPKLSGARILHAKTKNDVMNFMKIYY
jgi:hypothetical protein